MLKRFRMFPFFILEALEQERVPRSSVKDVLLKTLKIFLPQHLAQAKNHGLLLSMIFSGAVLIFLLEYRLNNLKEQVCQQEESVQNIQQRLFEKKKELTLLSNLQKTNASRVFEQMLNLSNLNRVNLANRLKTLAQEVGFQDMSFNLSPSKKILLNNALPIRFTTVTISYRVKSDVQLWQWMNRLYLEFPCFFVPKQLHILRVTDAQGALQNLSGTYTMDWIVFEPAF